MFDWTLNSSAAPGEPCTWGSACNGCDITSQHNGVTYCCAVDCDHGDLEISTNNGEVVCSCHH